MDVADVVFFLNILDVVLRTIWTWTHQTTSWRVNISVNCLKFIYQFLVANSTSNRHWLTSKQQIRFITFRNVPINRCNPKHVFQAKLTEIFAFICVRYVLFDNKRQKMVYQFGWIDYTINWLRLSEWFYSGFRTTKFRDILKCA